MSSNTFLQSTHPLLDHTRSSHLLTGRVEYWPYSPSSPLLQYTPFSIASDSLCRHSVTSSKTPSNTPTQYTYQHTTLTYPSFNMSSQYPYLSFLQSVSAQRDRDLLQHPHSIYLPTHHPYLHTAPYPLDFTVCVGSARPPPTPPLLHPPIHLLTLPLNTPHLLTQYPYLSLYSPCRLSVISRTSRCA